jgi:hypothetical protein
MHESICMFSCSVWMIYTERQILPCKVPADSEVLSGQHMAGQEGQACHALASKGFGWASGSQFEFGNSFSLPSEPGLAPCGWHCPHRHLTLRPGRLVMVVVMIPRFYIHWCELCNCICKAGCFVAGFRCLIY